VRGAMPLSSPSLSSSTTDSAGAFLASAVNSRPAPTSPSTSSTPPPLDLDRLYEGKSRKDVKVVIRRRVDAQWPQRAEYLVQWVGSCRGDARGTWVAQEWLEKGHGTAWAALYEFEEKRANIEQIRSVELIQAAIRGKHQRMIILPQLVHQRAARALELKKAREAAKEEEAERQRNVFLSRGPEVLAALYDYISSKRIRVMDVFHEIDEDGSGQLDKREFCQAMEKMMFTLPDGAKPRPFDLSAAFACLDQDGGGAIDSAEFFDALKEQKRVEMARLLEERRKAAVVAAKSKKLMLISAGVGGGDDPAHESARNPNSPITPMTPWSPDDGEDETEMPTRARSIGKPQKRDIGKPVRHKWQCGLASPALGFNRSKGLLG
jgi:hypothetical protein